MSDSTNANPPTRDPAIAVESLVVRYGRSTVLDGVDLAVEAGSVHALLGRNGAGKSSLVRCLLGQQKPQEGRVALFGHDIWRRRAPLMTRVGVVPETPDAPPHLDARALSRFCSRLYPRWEESALFARLERFGVPRDRAFGTLSKGQQAQLMLALALAHGPELLVLDDPTLGLDAVARRAVFEELVVELADRGTTVFLTSHDLPGIESIATRATLLEGGRFVFDEELESLKSRFRRLRFGPTIARERLESMEPLITTTRGRDTETIVARFDDDAYRALSASPDAERMEAIPLSLEEILVVAARRQEGAVASHDHTEV